MNELMDNIANKLLPIANKIANKIAN